MSVYFMFNKKKSAKNGVQTTLSQGKSICVGCLGTDFIIMFDIDKFSVDIEWKNNIFDSYTFGNHCKS